MSIPGLNLEACFGAHVGCPPAQAIDDAALGTGRPGQRHDLVGGVCHMLIHVCKQALLMSLRLDVHVLL